MSSSRASLEALSVLCAGVPDQGEGEAIRQLITASRGRREVGGGTGALTEQVVTLCSEHRVLPSLRALSNGPVTSDGVWAAFDLRVGLTLERALLATASVLREADIEFLVLKGLATGVLDYPSPQMRQSGDVDLLVREGDMSRVVHILRRSSWRTGITHPFRTPRFFHSETLVDPFGIEIDVHHRFTQASRAPKTIWDDAVPFELGGQQLWAPSMRWRFVHACVHQMMNPPPSIRRLNGLLDAYRIMSSPGFSLGQAMLAAREIRMEAVVGRCVERMYQVIDEPVPAMPRPERHWPDQWLSRLVDGTDPIPGYASLLTSLANQRWRDWPRYMRELAWPTKEYRDEIGRSPLGQITHVVKEAVGR